MTCNVDRKQADPTFKEMIVNCNCTGKERFCQLRDEGVDGYQCKENATTLCRSSVSNLAALFISSPNINECKDVDEGYIRWQHTWKSCTSEYSFNAVSYRVEIIILYH